MTMVDTNWKFYTTNEETLEAMIEACKNAKESIDMEQFIFIPDNFGNQLIDICERKAKEGVKIRFIWDAAGSFSLFGSNIIESLKEKGIELVFFKTLFPKFFDAPNYKSWYFRNHRRTLVIDKKIGFTGSICTSEKMKEWRETNVRIEGLVVNDMHRSFEKMWHRAHGKRLKKIKNEKYNDNEFRYISNSPIPRDRRLYKHILDAIRNSRKYIYIATPYFVPTNRLARTLKLASLRGIDIKIMIPEWSDQIFVDLCSRTFFNNMLKSGIKIFLYKRNMLHNKTIVIDGNWSSIGTLNMDNVSLLYNFEANIVSLNRKFTEELKSHFLNDIEDCKEITLSEWKSRYWVEKFASFFMYIVRGFF